MKPISTLTFALAIASVVLPGSIARALAETESPAKAASAGAVPDEPLAAVTPAEQPKAQLVLCNGRWTNRECKSNKVEAKLPATGGSHGSYNVENRPAESVLSKKKTSIHNLVMKNFRAKNDHGISIDTAAGEDYCLEEKTSLDDCRKRLAEMEDRIDKKVLDAKTVSNQEENNRIGRDQVTATENNAVSVTTNNVFVRGRRGPWNGGAGSNRNQGGSYGGTVGGTISGGGVSGTSGGSYGGTTGNTPYYDNNGRTNPNNRNNNHSGRSYGNDAVRAPAATQDRWGQAPAPVAGPTGSIAPLNPSPPSAPVPPAASERGQRGPNAGIQLK